MKIKLTSVYRLAIVLILNCTIVSMLNAQNIFPANGNVGIGTSSSSFPLSFGSSNGNTKISLWDAGGVNPFGFGIQSSQFRIHLGAITSRFSFLDGAAGNELVTIKIQRKDI